MITLPYCFLHTEVRTVLRHNLERWKLTRNIGRRTGIPTIHMAGMDGDSVENNLDLGYDDLLIFHLVSNHLINYYNNVVSLLQVFKLNLFVSSFYKLILSKIVVKIRQQMDGSPVHCKLQK